MKIKHFLACATLLTMSTVAMTACTSEAKPEEVMELRILATTDVHNYLMNYDYYTTSESDNYGMVKLATLMKEYQAETPEVDDLVIVDNGDILQGNPLGDYFNKVEPIKKGTTHPIYEAMEEMDYDVLGLGNHEFNYGIEYLQQLIEDTEIPVINSNVMDADGKKNEFNPYIILDKEVVDKDGEVSKVKVGVLNVVPEQILDWDRLHLDGKVTVEDIKNATETNVKKLQDEGADIIIALAHTGYGKGEYAEGEENVAAALTKVDGIDIVVGGHSHEIFPHENFDTSIGEIDLEKGTINDTYSVQPSKYAEGLGVVSLELTKDDKGKFTVVDGKSEYVSAEGVKNNEELEALIKPYHEEVIDYVNAPVGELTSPLTSFFALVADDASVQVVSDAQIDYVADLVKKSEELKDYKDLPILSAAAPFKAGLSKGETNPADYVDISAGNIAIKDVSNLYKYPNTLSILKLKGKDVKEWLEMSAGMFNQIEEGKESQSLLSQGFPSFNFDTIDGVTYEIDVTQPAKYDAEGNLAEEGAERIINLKYKGQPIDEEKDFLVVTNNYRAGGGGNFPIFPTGKELVYTSVDENRQIVANYIAKQGKFGPVADNNWKIKTLSKETRVSFESNSKASEFLKDYPAIKKGKEVKTDLVEYLYDLSVK